MSEETGGREAAPTEASHERRRLRWRCRRGMRELDALLEAFLDRDFAALDRGEIALLEQILDLPDPELHGYLVRSIEPEDRAVAALIARIRHSLHPQTGAVR